MPHNVNVITTGNIMFYNYKMSLLHSSLIFYFRLTAHLNFRDQTEAVRFSSEEYITVKTHKKREYDCVNSLFVCWGLRL